MLQINTDSLSHKFTGQAYNWIIDFGPKLFIAIILFILGQLIIRLINKGLKRILSYKGFDATHRLFLQNLLQILLQILLVLGLMQLLGIEMTLFAALIGAFGVAVGLSLSGTMQNFAAGVLIILLKPFRVGDVIRTQNEEGTVTIIKLFYTVIRTFSNTTLIVPNSKLSNEVIFNLTRENKRRTDVFIKFDHSVDFNRVKTLAMSTIDSLEDCLNDPPPKIGIDRIEIDGYVVVINAWINSHGFPDVRMNLNEKLMHALKPVLKKPDTNNNNIKPEQDPTSTLHPI